MRLNKTQIDEIVAIKDADVTKELLFRLFGKTEDNLESKYKPNDSFQLTKGMISVYTDTLPVITTIGRFIFNRFLNEGCFGTVFPYFNNVEGSKFTKQVVYALLEERVTTKQNAMFISKRTWLENAPTEILVPGMSFNMICPNPVVIKRKKELFKQYEKELAEGNAVIASRIEKELLNLARDINKDDPALRLFDRKKPSFGNNYKNMRVMIGAQSDNTHPGEYHISSSNFTEGIAKDEFAYQGDQLILGTYKRSVETSKGGAQMKEFSAAFQSEIIDIKKNSDCGTNRYINITLSEESIENYWLRFVITPNGLEQITPSTAKKFIGVPLKMRSVIFCRNEEYCSKCAGEFFQKMGIKNAGLNLIEIGSVIQGLSMKAFHDSTVQTTEFAFEKYFYD